MGELIISIECFDQSYQRLRIKCEEVDLITILKNRYVGGDCRDEGRGEHLPTPSQRNIVYTPSYQGAQIIVSLPFLSRLPFQAFHGLLS